MTRRVLALIVLALAAAPAPASAAVVSAPAGVKARLTSCVGGVATFRGDAPRLPAADRIQMRFTLQVLTPESQAWTKVAVPGWSDWVTSNPGVGRYVYTRRVEELVGPARYRAMINFRWLAGGKRLARARRFTRACRRPDPRPNLRVMAIEVTGRQYAVRVANLGREASGEFVLALESAGRRKTLRALAPGEREVVVFDAPPCAAGTQVTARVDPDDAVDERNEDDNVLGVSCP